MKINKIFLGLLATSIALAPMAAVVSCKDKSRKLPDQWLKDQDEKWNGNGKDQGLLQYWSVTKNTQNLDNWPLQNTDIFDWTFNSKATGLLPVTRLMDLVAPQGINRGGFPTLNQVGILNNVIDASINGQDGKPQAMEQTQDTDGNIVFSSINSFWNKQLTKKDIILKSDLLQSTALDIQKVINENPSKRFGALITTDTSDTLNGSTNKFDSGVYTIHLFALKPLTSDSKVENAVKLFNDKSKMAVDKDLVNIFGGTYLTGSSYGTVRLSSIAPEESDQEAARTIFAKFANQAFSSPTFKDRAAGDTIKDWFAFGPVVTDKKDTDWQNWKTSITQQDIDSVQGVKYAAYYSMDWKTQEYNLVVTAYEGVQDPNITNGLDIKNISTTYVLTPEIMSFVDDVDFKVLNNEQLNDQVIKPIVDGLPFTKIYDLFMGAEGMKGLMSSAPGALTLIVKDFSVLQFIAQSKNLIQDVEVFKRFLNELPTIDSTFNLNTFLKVIENQKDKDLESFMSFGGKRYSLLGFIPRFYSDFQTFVNKYPDLKDRLIGAAPKGPRGAHE